MVSDCITLVIDGNIMISLIKRNGLEGALNSIRSYREQLLSSDSQKMFLILTNMQGIIAEQRKKRRVFRFIHASSQRNPSSRSRAISSQNSTFDCVCITLSLPLIPRDCNISCFPCESHHSVAEWILKILQCIRDAPYQSLSSIIHSFSDPNYPNSA